MSTVAHRPVEARRLATIVVGLWSAVVGVGVNLAVVAVLAFVPRADPRRSA